VLVDVGKHQGADGPFAAHEDVCQVGLGSSGSGNVPNDLR
jgi:hypothetical protein